MWITQAVGISFDSGWAWHNASYIYIYITYAGGQVEGSTMKIEEVMACVR